jgi:cytochrome-b5 reductase
MSQKDVRITKYKIIDKQPVTHDASRFRFELQEGVEFDYLPGDHMKIYPDPGNPLEFKPYTPTTTPDIKGYFELIIKHYPDGKVSGYMKDRNKGDLVGMSGPHTGGHFADGMAKKVGMVAGGTGITPMISIIRSILKRGLEVEISLLFANKSVDDIILKDEFDEFSDKHDNFKRYYVVDKAPEGWEMSEGHITKEMMSERLFAPSDATVIFVCGPPMMQINMKKYLIELGHKKEKVIFP